MQFVQSFSCHVFAWEFELILWDAQKSVVLLLGRPTEAREREQNHKHDSMPLQMILVPPTVVVNCLQSYWILLTSHKDRMQSLLTRKHRCFFVTSITKPDLFLMLRSWKFQNHQQPVSLNIMYQIQWQLTTGSSHSLVNLADSQTMPFQNIGCNGSVENEPQTAANRRGKGASTSRSSRRRTWCSPILPTHCCNFGTCVTLAESCWSCESMIESISSW